MTNQPKMPGEITLHKIAMGEMGEMLTFVPALNENTPQAQADYIRKDTITPPDVVEKMAEALRLCADLLDDSITDGHYQEVAKSLAAYEESRK